SSHSCPSLTHPHLHSFPTRRSSDLIHRPGETTVAAPALQGHALEAAQDLHEPVRGGVVVDDDDFGVAASNSAIALEIANQREGVDRKSTRLNSSHVKISYAVFCLKK